MNKNLSDIEIMLNHLGQPTVPDDIHELAQHCKAGFVREMVAPKTTSIWKSRLSKCAALIVIALALIWAMHSLNIQPDGASTAFALADVVNAMKKTQCLHAIVQFEDGTDPNEDKISKKLHMESHGVEYWATINPAISVYKTPDGDITLAEYEFGKLTRYRPGSNTIEISESSALAEPGDYVNIAEKWLERIDRQAQLGGQVEYSDTVLDGQSVKLIKVSKCTLGAPNSVLMMYVDLRTRRPIKLYWTTAKPNGSKYWWIFDYPKTWPKDIYQAGAPRNAKVKNITPDSQFQDLLRKMKESSEQNFDRHPSQCIAIKVQRSVYPLKYVPDGITYTYIFYLDNGQYRRDRIRYISGDYRNTMNENTTHALGQSFASHYQWWRSDDIENFNCFRQQVDFANKHTGQHVSLKRNKVSDRAWQIIGRRKEKNADLYHIKLVQEHPLFDLGHAATSLAWPSSYDRGKRVIVDAYSSKHNLVCVEALEQGYIYKPTEQVTLPRRTLSYLDPAKAYLRTRLVHIYKRDAEWHDDPGWLKDAPRRPRGSHYRIWQVLKYAKTKSGMWYVKEQAYDNGSFGEDSEFHIDHPADLKLKPGSVTRVYLNEAPEFPADIFDPNAMPALSDAPPSTE
jgi:hypothetical protein